MEKPKFHKIIDNLDYFVALLANEYPDADLMSINKFVQIIKTKYYYKYWKDNEFDLQMIQVFADLYLKIDPITKNYPTLKEKYQDITSSENTNINTSGNIQTCQQEPLIKDIKNYIVSILTQDASYSKNDVKTESMNRNLLEDVQKILNLPTQLNFINKAVLALQPYVYDKPRNCDDCGKCDMCSRVQKFDPNSQYYTTIMKRIDEISKKVDYFDRKKQGPQGPVGPQGLIGPEGPQGPKGDQGPAGETYELTAEKMFQHTVQGIFALNTSVTPSTLSLDLTPFQPISQKIIYENDYENLLNTTNKTIIGAINEIKSSSTTINLNGIKPIDINKIDAQYDIILKYDTNDFLVNAPDYNLQINKTNIQKKLKPTGNIDLQEDGSIRAFDASFDNNLFLKNFSLYLATDSDNVEVSDGVLYTTAAINKFYQTKTSNRLITDNKGIEDAINELATKVENIKQQSANIQNNFKKVTASMNTTLSKKELITDEQLDINNVITLLKKVKIRENVLITTPNTRTVMTEEELEYNTKYFITVTWDGIPEGNQITYEYVQTDAKINTPIATFNHSYIEGREPNILQLENTGNSGFRIITKSGLQNTDGFIIKLEKEKKLIEG